MKFFKPSLALLFLSVLPGLQAQQDYLFEVQKIGIQQGLPHRNVFSVVQDREGYIWLSTTAGVHRYDGHSYLTYPVSSLHTDDNTPLQLAVDQKNRIWFAEQNYLNRNGKSGIIDPAGDTILSIEEVSRGLLHSEDIIRISSTPKELLIITRKGEIYSYKERFRKIIDFNYSQRFRPLAEPAKGDKGYWLLNEQWVCKIEKNQVVDSFSIQRPDLFLTRIVSQHPELIVEARNFSRTSYWRVDQNGLTPYIQKGIEGKFHLIYKEEGNSALIVENHLIVANDNGQELCRAQIQNKESFTAFMYRHPLIDSTGIMWLGFAEGLIKVIKRPNPFSVFQKGQSIRGIYRNGNTLWVGSYDENVSIDLATGQKELLMDIAPIALCNFVEYQPGKFWMGTSVRTIVHYNAVKGDHRVVELGVVRGAPLLFMNESTYSLLVGTEEGAFKLNSKTGDITALELPVESESVAVRQFFQNERGIWITTTKGLFLMNSYTDEIILHLSKNNGLPSENLLFTHIDEGGIFWLATKDAGLIKWNVVEDKFTQFTTSEGLSNNTLYAIYEDEKQNFWIPSNNGLIRFNKTTGNSRAFLVQNGIPHEEFNTFSHFKDEYGNLYFGGLGGLIKFHPDDLNYINYHPVPLRISNIRMLEKGKPELTDISRSFSRDGLLSLPPSADLLELELSFLDFEDTENRQYGYRIPGLQDRWVYSPDHKITLFSLPYGNHILELRAKGLSSGNISPVVTIPIEVLKPIYLRWYNILFISLLAALALFMMVRWRVTKLKKERARLEKEVMRRTAKIKEDSQTMAVQAKKLERLDEARSRFFSNLTHEFRTPLTLIIGPLEQIVKDPPPAGILKRRVQGVLKNARHIMTLINQLLDLSKIENGAMTIEAVHGDIVKHTEELVKRFQPLALKKEQRLIFLSASPHLNLYFDVEKWDKILYNLISNSIKFTPVSGSIQVCLSWRQCGASKLIKLDVRDTGVGMNEKELSKVFHRFYQADSSHTRSQEGTGIGMALVKEIVQLLGGQVQAFSSPGKGTSIEILLPELNSTEFAISPELIAEQINVEVPQPVEKESVKSDWKESKEQPLEILLVEDNEDMRDYIRQCLSGSNFKIIEASNGEEGLEQSQTMIPDLIISDVMMPKMDGFSMVEHIRNNINTSHIPLVLLTAKSSLSSRLSGIGRGADAYLTKPFSPEELKLRIQNLLELRSAIRQRYHDFDHQPVNKTFKKEDEFIMKLENYILEFINEPDLNGDRIGAHFAMSRVHLYRKLKALTGQSISEYVKSIRLKRALELIREGELNISEIAYQTGFSSDSHFSRSFKKAYGTAPSRVV